MTTGSAVQGTIGGLVKGLAQQEAATQVLTDKVIYVKGSPDANVPGFGSQLAYDTENQDVYINISGTTQDWERLGSLT